MSIRSFVSGLLLGASLVGGFTAYASSDSPKIVGESGVLEGFEVVDRNGDRVCVDPDFLKDSGIISCE